MPFINERLEANKELVEQEKYKAVPARTSRFRFSPEPVMQKLRARIIGQDDVLSAIEDMLITLKADFGATNRPLCVFFLLGPTGVGKTETVRVLAEALRGDAKNLCRIDMNTLAQDHYSAALTGSPPGYVGSKDGQTLFQTEHIKGSFSEPGILLFDEVEKAGEQVIRAFMNMLDTGKMTLTSGTEELDFSNTLVFMTSNIGAHELGKAYELPNWKRWLISKSKRAEAILDKALHHKFDPEFLNRLDRILAYKPLHQDQRDALLSIELTKLNHRLKRRNASLILESSARTYLCAGFDKRYGARDLARRVRVELEPALAKALMDTPEAITFSACRENDNLLVSPVD